MNCNKSVKSILSVTSFLFLMVCFTACDEEEKDYTRDQHTPEQVITYHQAENHDLGAGLLKL
jgi:uncharacterized lipoprotein YehR (DUF1307 family)